MIETLKKKVRTGSPSLAEARKYAAVAAILVGDIQRPDLLYIRRAERAGDPWSGQMAFPGGKREAHDATLLDTAIREVREEIGLQLFPEQCLGWLEELRATARGVELELSVFPYVFWLPDGLPQVHASEEVSETLQIEVARLRGPELRTTFPYRYGSDTLHFPAINVNGRLVWGMTYRMTEQLLVASAETSFDHG